MVFLDLDGNAITIPGRSGQRGATTALASWIRRDNEVEDGLAYGTQAGYLVVWKERVKRRYVYVLHSLIL